MRKEACYRGIYGFDFTREMEFEWGRFIPHCSPSEAAKSARHPSEYKLTGVLEDQGLSLLRRHDLSALLSFIEQLEVVVAHSANRPRPEDFPSVVFPPHHLQGVRSSSDGAIVMRDIVAPKSRQTLIGCAMEKLAGEEPEKSALRSCFFKHVHGIWQFRRTMDVDYFLNFSGLESLAKDRLKLSVDSEVDAAPAMNQYLQGLGFRTVYNQPKNPERSMQTYAHLRNASFHRGQYAATVKVKKDFVTYDLKDGYLARMRMLVSLALLKEFGFDDGHINWNSWLDMQPFC